MAPANSKHYLVEDSEEERAEISPASKRVKHDSLVRRFKFSGIFKERFSTLVFLNRLANHLAKTTCPQQHQQAGASASEGVCKGNGNITLDTLSVKRKSRLAMPLELSRLWEELFELIKSNSEKDRFLEKCKLRFLSLPIHPQTLEILYSLILADVKEAKDIPNSALPKKLAADERRIVVKGTTANIPTPDASCSMRLERLEAEVLRQGQLSKATETALERTNQDLQQAQATFLTLASGLHEMSSKLQDCETQSASQGNSISHLTQRVIAMETSLNAHTTLCNSATDLATDSNAALNDIYNELQEVVQKQHEHAQACDQKKQGYWLEGLKEDMVELADVLRKHHGQITELMKARGKEAGGTRQ